MTPRIERVLDQVRGIYVRGILLAGGARVAAAGSALLVVFFAADNVCALPAAVRVALAAVFLGAIGVIGWRGLLRPLLGEMPPEAAAIILEQRFPELDCRLINGMLLEERGTTPLGARVLAHTVAEAEEFLRALRLPRVFDGRRLKLLGLAGGGGLLALALYALVLPAYFGNACARFAMPFGDVAHVGRPAIKVTPGDVTLAPGEVLTVRAAQRDTLPERATLEKDASSFAMTFDGQAFVFSFPPADTQGYTYRVRIGSSTSPRYTVKIARPPAIIAMRHRYDFPQYTGMPARFEERAAGPVRCLKGTTVTATVGTDAPLAGGVLVAYGKESPLALKDECCAEAKFEVTGAGTYALVVKGKGSGLEGGRERVHAIELIADAAPVAAFTEPAAQRRYRIGAPLKAALRASDDLGVATLVLEIAETTRGPWRTLKRWEGEKGKLLLQGEVILTPKEARLALRGVARDFLGQEAVTPPLELSAQNAEELQERELAQIGNALASLRRILELQEALLGKTREALREERASAQSVVALSEAQGVILKESATLLGTWDKTGFSADKRLRFALLAAEGMPQAAAVLRAAATAQDVRAGLRKGAELEANIVAELKAIIGELNELAAHVKDLAREELASAAERAARKKAALGDLKNELGKFIEAQKKVLETSEKLSGAKVDDFSAAEADFAKLAQEEERLAGEIKAKAHEYAKLGAQDFADGTLAEELIEVYSEVDLAADALKARNVEIAVPHEQSGLELARSLETNIERWLVNVPDKIKWSMEDPLADVEVPMADLPTELEDLVGDLIDQEEEMTEDVEDVTSGWLDSLDKGAGWDAMDGPISNMSAKGVTGNLLPNNNEIGGRSGEGRSGRSFGQMVEKEATGKGGRPTPTRATPDPFEQGQVNDKGTDPTGGATGGGKLAGTGPEGLRGPTGPEMAEKLRGLAAKQSRIRSEAERMERRLRQLNVSPENLERALELMRSLEDALNAATPANVAEVHERVVRQLRDMEADLVDRAGSTIDADAVPRELREGIANAGNEEIPEAYEREVREYFEALNRGGEK